MSAEIIQLRDFQNKKDLERLYAEIGVSPPEPREPVPFGGQGIDGMTFPDNDPA